MLKLGPDVTRIPPQRSTAVSIRVVCSATVQLTSVLRLAIVSLLWPDVEKTYRMTGVAHFFHTDNSIKQYIKYVTIILI